MTVIVLSYISVYHFAEYTNLLNASDTINRNQKQLNIYLKSLYKRLLAKKIFLNYSRTEIIILPRLQSKWRSLLSFSIKTQKVLLAKYVIMCKKIN